MREIKLPSLNGAHDCTLHCKGAFTNDVDKFLIFSDHLPPYIDNKLTFLDYLPTSSCQHSLWMPPYCKSKPQSLKKSSHCVWWNGAFLKENWTHSKGSIPCCLCKSKFFASGKTFLLLTFPVVNLAHVLVLNRLPTWLREQSFLT